MKPEIVVDNPDWLGEGPLWHREERKLYWLDIKQGRIFSFDPSTGESHMFWEGPVTGGFTFQADGTFLLFMENGAVARLQNGAIEYLIDELPNEVGNRFNDVISDPVGRVFCGTMPSNDDRALRGLRLGTLYRLDLDGSIKPLFNGCGIPNGMGFTKDAKHMFFTDSTDHTIYVFDYDQTTGAICNRRPFIRTDPNKGLPDGMTVDFDGHIWSARALGASLYRYSPNGVEEMCIEFPANIVSSVTFGGNDLGDVYCTSIGGDNKKQHGSGAGALFKLNVEGVRGIPEYYSRIRF